MKENNEIMLYGPMNRQALTPGGGFPSKNIIYNIFPRLSDSLARIIYSRCLSGKIHIVIGKKLASINKSITVSVH